MPLNKRQQKFCEQYLISLNAKQAATIAGYSERTAVVQASQLLTNIKIQEFISKALAERSKRTEITADFVLQSLKEVALRCMQKAPVMEWDYENKCLSQKVDEEGNDVWEFDSAGANKALELLGKHLALFVDRKDIKADISIRSVEVKVISTGQPKINSEKDIKD